MYPTHLAFLYLHHIGRKFPSANDMRLHDTCQASTHNRPFRAAGETSDSSLVCSALVLHLGSYMLSLTLQPCDSRTFLSLSAYCFPLHREMESIAQGLLSLLATFHKSTLACLAVLCFSYHRSGNPSTSTLTSLSFLQSMEKYFSSSFSFFFISLLLGFIGTAHLFVLYLSRRCVKENLI